MSNIKVNVNGVTFNAYPRPFWSSVNNGTWEPHTFKTFNRCLDKNHSMIDIGAWIGPTTLYGAHLAKHVYSFEPDVVAYDELRYNIMANPDVKNKIDTYPTGISDVTGTVSFGTQSSFGDSMSSLLFKDNINALTIRCVTLQSVFDVHDITDCNFVKMDTEGGETIILPHIANFLVENNITLFVSMHPFWFKNLPHDVTNILHSLAKFQSLRDCTGQPITLDIVSKLLMAKQGVDILCGHSLKPTPAVI